MNQKTLREGVITGAMCNVCGLVCQRLINPEAYGVPGVRNSYGGLIAHKRRVHPEAVPKRDRPA